MKFSKEIACALGKYVLQLLRTAGPRDPRYPAYWKTALPRVSNNQGSTVSVANASMIRDTTTVKNLYK